MIDFIVNTVAEVIDFFIDFYTDKVIDKFAKKKPDIEKTQKTSPLEPDENKKCNALK